MKSNKLTNFFKTSNINFVGHAKYYLVAIGAILISAIIIISVIGLKLGFDFKGGTVIEVVYGVGFDDRGNPYENGAPYDEKLTKEKIDKVINKIGGFDVSSIQKAESEFGDKVVYKLIANEKLIQEQYKGILNALYEEFESYNQEGLIQSKYISAYGVEGAMTSVAKYAAIALSVAVVFLALCVFFRYGISAALTILLTSLINIFLVFAIVLISRITVDVSFIASVLTIFAFTLISNLIYFDKIRENEKLEKELSRKDIANICVKQSFTPNILIFSVSLICTILLTGLGVLPIRAFGFPVMAGLFFVVLSSVYLAPCFYNYITFNKKKKK